MHVFLGIKDTKVTHSRIYTLMGVLIGSGVILCVLYKVGMLINHAILLTLIGLILLAPIALNPAITDRIQRKVSWQALCFIDSNIIYIKSIQPLLEEDYKMIASSELWPPFVTEKKNLKYYEFVKATEKDLIFKNSNQEIRISNVFSEQVIKVLTA